MAIDCYLQIPSLNSESLSKDFLGQFLLESFSFDVATSVNNNGSVSAPNFSSLAITIAYDSAAPILFFDVCAGSNLGTCVITMRKSAGAAKSGFVFAKWTLDNVILTEMSMNSDPSQMAINLSLAFSRFTFESDTQKPDGTLGRKTVRYWDISRNQGG